MNTSKILGNPEKRISPLVVQGDCILKKCGDFDEYYDGHKSIPKDAEEVVGNLLLKGQTNSHALYGGKFQLLKKDNVLFLRVDETTVLDHVKDLISNENAEHHAQYIPKGEYFLDELLEYDHVLMESRRVID